MKLTSKHSTWMFTNLFLATTAILFFQNCGSSFNSAALDSINSSSASQGNSSPIENSDTFQTLTGFNKIVNLNNRLCNFDSTGSISCLGTSQNRLAGSTALVLSFSDKLVPLSWGVPAQQMTDSCILSLEGKVFCSGNNFWGQAGLDPAIAGSFISDRNELTSMGGIVKKIAQGNISSNCALLNSGEVKCWGLRFDLPFTSNNQNQNTFTPGLVAGLGIVKDLFANEVPAQYCALLQNDDLYCWGQKTELVSETNSTPVKVLNAANIKKVITGIGSSFCVLFNSGQVSCYKDKASNGLFNLEVKAGLGQVLDISANEGTRCTRNSDADVYCWGTNMFGRLGFVLKHWAEVAPTLIPEWKNAISVETSRYNTCALMPDTSVKCLGYTANGTFYDWLRIQTNFTQLGITASITDLVSTGYGKACFKTVSGNVQCLSALYQHYDFSVSSFEFQKIGTEFMSKPISIPATQLNGLQFGIGSGEAATDKATYGCYIDTNQSVKCWGQNQYGQLGNGTKNYSASLVTVDGLTNIIKLQNYNYTYCALSSLHKLYCWGQISPIFEGLNLTDDVASPVQLSQLGDVQDFNLGYYGVQVMKLDGSVKSNVGGFMASYDISGAKAYSFQTSCAHMTDNTVKCFESKGAVTDGYKVIPNLNSTNYKFFYAFVPCAINAQKQIQCWGSNDSGQLGQLDRIDHLGAMTVKNISNAYSVFIGPQNVICASVDENLGDQSKILCWGSNYTGINSSLAVFEETKLRGYKPSVAADGSVNYYINSSGQVISNAVLRISAVPYSLVYKK